ncbi:hypothetical protein OG453_38200 [Streptomyces sp. NBC_01381]|uniref:hypothetical protein n=1 Tax=Streptomyces sp. NBC_01381 TaxID=2903845 RepID=UPI00225C33F9|nr:hypothetical protein [Streptomyces sp. NBC_01381]MCX4672423.1 hypothetical protein [Streptomyces sp. NBC_01381]
MTQHAQTTAQQASQQEVERRHHGDADRQRGPGAGLMEGDVGRPASSQQQEGGAQVEGAVRVRLLVLRARQGGGGAVGVRLGRHVAVLGARVRPHTAVRTGVGRIGRPARWGAGGGPMGGRMRERGPSGASRGGGGHLGRPEPSLEGRELRICPALGLMACDTRVVG